MQIIIAMDSFKGCLNSIEAGNAVAIGVRRAMPQAKISVFRLSDGGEGLLDALIEGNEDGRRIDVLTFDPLMRQLSCSYGVIANTTAIIESAACCGLPLLSAAERNPLHTTTYGLGLMIRNALNNGLRSFIIGLGGSSTNDCGMGMLAALGYRFYSSGVELTSYDGNSLRYIDYIDDSYADERLRDCTFRVACDVTNPLLGINGATHVYAAQKGASDDAIKLLEFGMKQFVSAAKHIVPPDSDITPGCGAAGGLGYAFSAILSGVIVSGTDLVLAETPLGHSIEDADIFITGEGKLDSQTLMGKAPLCAARFAKEHGAITIALTGNLDIPSVEALNKAGIDACFSIQRAPCSQKQATSTKRAIPNLATCSEQIMRIICAHAQFNKS